MIEKIREILKGIDKDECEDKNGWWETSYGAEFGAKKLKEIEDLVKEVYQQGFNDGASTIIKK